MKVANPTLRKVVSYGLATLMVLYENFGLRPEKKLKAKITRRIVEAVRPHNKMLQERYMPTPVNKRPVQKLEGLNLKTEEWYEGHWYVEEHDASHLHNDFSIVVNNKVYRMARTPSSSNKKKGHLGLFPGPKEKVAWKLQYEHYPNEVPNRAILDDGYGAGTTKVVDKGRCMVRLSRNGNLDCAFEGVDGVYSLIEKDKDCLVIRKFKAGPEIGKHKMKVGINTELQAYCDNPDYVFVAKYEGSHCDWQVVKHTDGKKYLRVYSWRLDKRLHTKYGVDNQIDHTHKLLLCDEPFSDDMPICSGRGELWIGGKKPLTDLNGVLNSGTYVARANPNNARVQLIVHDIVEHEDIDLEHYNYEQKLVVFEDLHRRDDRFNVPEWTKSQKGKEKLWQHLKTNPAFDGIVAWDSKSPDKRAVKIKFKHEPEFAHQGYIVAVEDQTGVHSDKYSYPIIENEEGVRFKCAGKGMTNELKADMHKNPHNYIGRKVYYSAEEHFEESGLPRQPVLKEII